MLSFSVIPAKGRSGKSTPSNEDGETSGVGIQSWNLIYIMFYSTRHAFGHFSGTFSAKSTQKHLRDTNSLFRISRNICFS